MLKLETNVQHILVCQNNTFVFTVYPSFQTQFQSSLSFTESSSPSTTTNAKYIPLKAKTSASAINKTNLIPASQTLGRYPKLQHESKVSILGVKLARESFFGEDVLALCTVMGFGKLPALPNEELKQTLFSLFPRYWSNPVDFESVWKDCAESLGQVCKRLRLDREKKGL